jgi:hypothetical protein
VESTIKHLILDFHSQGGDLGETAKSKKDLLIMKTDSEKTDDAEEEPQSSNEI